MFRVFLAYSYREEDKDLARRVDALLESHGISVVTGEAVGGQSLTAGVKKLIDESDALVALLTRRNQLAQGQSWSTHNWVRDELNYARDRNKYAVAIVDTVVETGGMNQEYERIDLDSEKEPVALVKLSRIAGEWAQQHGRLIKIRILPDALGDRVGAFGSRARCECRFRVLNRPGPWSPVECVREPGGTYAWVPGANPDALIQLKVEIDGETWASPEFPQLMDATLRNTYP